MGIFWAMFLFFMLYHSMISGNFYGLEIRHGIFLVLNFVGGFFWVLLEALGMPPFHDPPFLFISGVPP